MSETKQESNLSLIWELVLYIILIFSIVGLPFLNGHYYSYSDTSQVFLFRKSNSVFWGQEFKGVVNSYFIISLILLIVLPVVTNKIGYLIAIAIGTVITALVVSALKKPVTEEVKVEESSNNDDLELDITF